MALRDKLKERVQPLLEPGEAVQEVGWAQDGTQTRASPS